MPDWLLYILVPGGCALLIGLVMDDVIPVPLHRLTDFPFKGKPSTNGAVWGTVLIAGVMAVAWLVGAGAHR